MTGGIDKITTGRPDLVSIAEKYGWLRGSRVDYINQHESRGHEVDFVDAGPDNCDAEELIGVCRRHEPEYVVAGDYDGDNYAEINELAERLRPHARRVILTPHKSGEVERVPEWAVVGYSTPSSYAGTDAPVWEYRGRDIHILGGTIDQSLEVRSYLGGDVVSFDCNSFHRSATQFVKWWGSSSPKWNTLAEPIPKKQNCQKAYENTMLNMSYYLRERSSEASD